MAIILMTPPVPSGGGGGDLEHGELFTVTGSGFGTKSSVLTLWDDCQGTNVLTKWENIWHDVGGDDQWKEDYRLPNDADIPVGARIPAFHANAAKMLCGCHQSESGGIFGSEVIFTVEYDRPANPYYVTMAYYNRQSPGWDFKSGSDFNFKECVNGYGSGYGYTGTYWYTGPQFFSAVTEGNTMAWGGVNGESSGPGGAPNFAFAPTYCERYIKFHSSTGAIKFLMTAEGDTPFEALDDTNIETESDSDTHKTLAMGGYSRDYREDSDAEGDTLWRFYGDIYIEIDESNPGALVLTNNATYLSSTIFQHQPWFEGGSWADGSITAKCNKGALSSGTVHVHLRDEVNGHQYLGTRTMT